MKTYYLILFFTIFGFCLGIYLSLTGYKITSLLVTNDKLLFDYITGTASYISIFYSRMKTMLIAVVIILFCNLTYYTAFINYIYLTYQSALIVLSCGGIISLYRLSGILNVIFFIIPINLLTLLSISFLIVVSLERSRNAYKFKIPFRDSFNQLNYYSKFGYGMLLMLVNIIFASLVLPLLMRSLTIIIF